MERVPEPELMEEKEQVISYDKADFSEGEVNLINQINHYLLRKNISLGEKDLIVDLGCGPGNISEKLAIKWPNTEVVGIDGSKEMILRAEYNKSISTHQKKLKNLRYICSDIKDIKSNNSLLKNGDLFSIEFIIEFKSSLFKIAGTVSLKSSFILLLEKIFVE